MTVCPIRIRIAGAALVLAVLGASGPAAADGLVLGGARGIGRAGANMVSDDTGAALLLNPGGLVRRAVTRAQLGLVLHDQDLDYRAADMPDWFPGTDEDSPRIEDQGAPARLPLLAVQVPLGPVVASLALVEPSDWSRTLPAPGGDPRLDAADVARLYPHRYGGTLLAHERRMLGAGAAVRARPWLGIGAAVWLAREELREHRHVWAGVAGRDALADPSQDVSIRLAGDDLVPGASAGALIAPLFLPLEIGLSASFAAGGRLRGTAGAWPVLADATIQVDRDTPTARTRLPDTLVVRAGIRYLGERVLLEAGGDVTAYLGDPPTWQVTGVSLRDETAGTVPLPRIPSFFDRRAHGAVRAAADVDIVPGFLWLSGGYAYRTSASRASRMAPAHADPGGHTLALGAEANASGITLTVGYARTLARKRQVTDSTVTWIAPFGDSPPQPLGLGTYEVASDVVGAAVEIAWD